MCPSGCSVDPPGMDTSHGATRAIHTLSPPSTDDTLSVRPLNLMRAGDLLMAVGLAVTRWPLVAHPADGPAPSEPWR